MTKLIFAIVCALSKLFIRYITGECVNASKREKEKVKERNKKKKIIAKRMKIVYFMNEIMCYRIK